MINSPCLNCQDRHPKCHNETCPNGWMEYQERVKEEKQRIAARKKAESDTTDYIISSMIRTKEWMGRE